MSSRSESRARVLALLSMVVALVAALAPTAGAQQQPTPQAFANGTVSFAGHGWGHGRGMGQWGAYGYAVDQGSSYGDIVDHFYGNTTAAQIPNPQITVRIVGQDGIDLVVTSDSDFTVGGIPIAGGSAGHLVYRPADGKFDLYTRVGCLGGDVWYGGTVDPTARSNISDPGNDVHQMLAICQPDQHIREYRGNLILTFGDGATRTLNSVDMEDYLRGVVPRESPASWADTPNGVEALKAQAVAARSYALGEGGEDGGRYSYAKTCDTTSCQVYGGAGLDGQRIEDNRSDVAVAFTGGQIRRMADGSVARTEFSSSTGGWTAGGQFPAVEDLGDSRSPFHDWSTSVPVSTVQSKYNVGTLRSFTVTARNGLGADGGRATNVQISGSSGTVNTTGGDVQAKLGLRSDWFVPSDTSAAPPLQFFERNSNTAGPVDASFTFGQQGDIPLACDWDGSGGSSPGIYRKGGWLLATSNTQDSSSTFLQYGDTNDVPVCGDWDGNGTQTVGVFRQGMWYLRNANTTGTADLAFGFGDPTDIPVVGDWNADGKDSVGVYRNGVFYLTNTNATGVADRVVGFGDAGDRPVVGDWDGDTDTNVGVFRNGIFYLRDRNITGAADQTFSFGAAGDYPLAGDWDGNRTDTPGVARISG